MKYERIKKGVFKERPNRFIAHIEIDEKIEVCHVKNTGRCRELLAPDARVFVQKSANPNRKTAYDLISVYKGETLFNIDSNAPNRVFFEWAKESGYFGEIDLIKPESRYGNSRFDFTSRQRGKRFLLRLRVLRWKTRAFLCSPMHQRSVVLSIFMNS